jgi:hypothetical protein
VGAGRDLEPDEHERQAAHRQQLPLRGFWEQRESGALFVGERRNEIRLPVYARLDVRGNRVFNDEKRRLTLFVEVMNVLNRDNVRAVSPSSINGRTRLVTGYLQSLFPLMRPPACSSNSDRTRRIEWMVSGEGGVLPRPPCPVMTSR